MKQQTRSASAVGHERRTIYLPPQRPGFAAWTAAFDYGDGRLGLSFKETVREKNTGFRPPRLELGEAVGAPVSYCSVECGGSEEQSYRVYLLSEDGGRSYRESGRCPLEEGPFCCTGFPDGRVVGLTCPDRNAGGTGGGDGILVRESRDGGTTWRTTDRLLEGCAPYLWRIRRLRDGSFLLLASMYGTPWGKGLPRATRNTMLPGETYLNKIQTFLLHSRDGVRYSGPHYVLPGTGAHEYDMVELSDGTLLLLAGDVQATPAARQLVPRIRKRIPRAVSCRRVSSVWRGTFWWAHGATSLTAAPPIWGTTGPRCPESLPACTSPASSFCRTALWPASATSAETWLWGRRICISPLTSSGWRDGLRLRRSCLWNG